MSAKRILYITQEISPYNDDSHLSLMSRKVPEAIQSKGKEIRTFMPKYASINERRNQLHEVIRLSGMNLIIDDNDHSLIIKVASILPSRMQVYFIDNEDFFQNRHMLTDEQGEEYPDNDERSVFFVRGVMETIKKLRWIPDIIHCHGSFSAFAPLYIKEGYRDDPCFSNTKVIYSIYDDKFNNSYRPDIAQKLRFEGIGDTEIAAVESMGELDFDALTKLAIQHADGIVAGAENTSLDLLAYAKERNLPIVDYNADFDKYVDDISELYSAVSDNED